MRYFILLFAILCIVGCGHSSKDSYNGDYTIANQSDMDYISGYHTITGNLDIAYSELTNLDGLSSLSSIGKDLHISANPELTCLNGLRNLTLIVGRLGISSNESLTSIDGLNSLVSIGSTQATDDVIHGISVADEVGILVSVNNNGVSINSNDSLTNLDGLNNLTTIGGDLHINSNSVLPASISEEFANRITIGGEVFFRAEEYISFEDLSSISQ